MAGLIASELIMAPVVPNLSVSFVSAGTIGRWCSFLKSKPVLLTYVLGMVKRLEQ